jgi:hypothetical protein
VWGSRSGGPSLTVSGMGLLDMDMLISLSSALAVGLIAVVLVLTLIVPMLSGLFAGRRREDTEVAHEFPFGRE